ncbi:Uncharacterised protein [Lysinibacillus sphaericus]|nr:Uncharacterised protein [Lysinibacillus sphaericus]
MTTEIVHKIHVGNRRIYSPKQRYSKNQRLRMQLHKADQFRSTIYHDRHSYQMRQLHIELGVPIEPLRKPPHELMQERLQRQCDGIETSCKRYVRQREQAAHQERKARRKRHERIKAYKNESVRSKVKTS